MPYDPSGAEISRLNLQKKLGGVFNRYSPSDTNASSTDLNPKRDVSTSVIRDLDEVELELFMAYQARLTSLRERGLGMDRPTNEIGANTSPEQERDPDPIIEFARPSSGVRQEPKTDDVSDVEDVLALLEQTFGGDPSINSHTGFNLCDIPDSDMIPIDVIHVPSALDVASLQNIINSIVSDPPPDWNELDQIDTSAQCWVIELGILRMLLALIAAISSIMRIISRVLSVVTPIIELVVLVASVWLMPQNITKIARRLSGIAISASLNFMMALIKRLFDGLNVDCLMSGPISVMNQVGMVMSGGMTTMSQANSFVALIDNEKEAAASGLVSAKEAIAGVRDAWAEFELDSTERTAMRDYLKQSLGSYEGSVEFRAGGASTGASVTATTAGLETETMVSTQTVELAAARCKGGIEIF